MKTFELNSFMILSINGTDKISYTYTEFDNNGNQISCNNKRTFNVDNNSPLQNHIAEIKKYIKENKLSK